MVLELVGRLFGHDYVSVATVKLDVIRSLLSEHFVDIRVAAAKSARSEDSALIGVAVVRYVINNLLHWIGRLVSLIMR